MIKFSKTNYFGNDSGISCKIGDIFQKDGNDFIYLGNIFSNIPSLKKNKLISKGKINTFTLTNQSKAEVRFEAKYGAPLRDSEVRITFANKHSAFAHLKKVTTYSLAIANIKTDLYKYWRDKGYIDDVKNYCLINTLFEVNGGGKILFSKCSNTSVTLTHSQGLPVKTYDGLLSANLSITGEASTIGSIDIQSIGQPIVTMVRWYKSLTRNKFRYM
jgi:hypothetical protein